MGFEHFRDHCYACGRPLKRPFWRILGYGPECWEKVKMKPSLKETLEREAARIAHDAEAGE